MDERGKIVREKNPWDHANLFSRLVFGFACGTFRKGLRKDLDESDIYEPARSCLSGQLGDRLENEWRKEVKRDPSNPSLLRCLFRLFGFEYAMLGLSLLICSCSVVMAKPLLKGKIISYFSPDHSNLTQADALYYTGALVGCSLIQSIFNYSYFFLTEQLSLKVKIAICALIYRKSLRISSVFTSRMASGKAVTLITKDINTFETSLFLAQRFWVALVEIFLMTYLMYKQIGVSALVGTTALFGLIPIQIFLGYIAAKFRLKTALKTDQRVRITQEILTAIRIIKMYTWEKFFSKSVNNFRKKEIRNLKFLFCIRATAMNVGQLNGQFAFYLCVITYILLGNHITAEKAFVVIGCFTALRMALGLFLPMASTQFGEVRISLQRISGFLNLPEVQTTTNHPLTDEGKAKICLANVKVQFEKDTILENVRLEIKPGLILLTGIVGAGKSTLLKLLLGDVEAKEGKVEIVGKMSYSSQEPWLFAGTAKQNILFGEHYDPKRYSTVIKVCALEKDFADLPLGDRTCVTDKGLNLSRGQKTRINLARAIYKSADIYLLDDCLSAVDPHVAKYVFQECIRSFLKEKLCILVTHQDQFLQEADTVLILNNKGSLTIQERRQLKQSNWKLNEDAFGQTLTCKEIEKLDEEDEASKLIKEPIADIYEETIQAGVIKKEVYLAYIKSGGGFKILFLILLLFVAAQWMNSWLEYFVSYWVDTEQAMSGFRFNHTTNSSDYKTLEDAHGTIMTQYSFVILGATIFMLSRAVGFYVFSSKVSTNIHAKIFANIINASMGFFDDNLSGNILNRFSRDLDVLDEHLPMMMMHLLRTVLMVGGNLFVITSVTTIFLLPSAIFLAVLFASRHLYIRTGRSIRRLEGATRSPVVGQFNATLEGLTTIRACEVQPILVREFENHLNTYNSVAYMNYFTTNGFGLYLDFVCLLYVVMVTLTFLLFKTDILAGKVGLAITQSFSLADLMQWAIRAWAEIENQMTSVERVLEYTKIEPEGKSGVMASDWPNSGKIVYQHVNLCYSNSQDMVLKDINFTIEPKEKIGVVGRTGAGKTSIISTLFRLYKCKGEIFIDDVDISTVQVELLRSKISIIPQDPVLFTGSVRCNLDPNNQYSDKELWDALEEVDLKNAIGELEAEVNEGGANFSLGQRQLLCLARAIVRNNAILVLDEATANIDPQTDLLIQKTIKRKFSECTVITIAHRLNTIMDSDRIMVMDSGRVIEYDAPERLLENKKSAFYQMAMEGGFAV